MDLHPSQRRFSCELCRKSKARCQRIHPDDPSCVRCTLANALCHPGEQRKVGRPKRKAPGSPSAVASLPVTNRRKQSTNPSSRSQTNKQSRDHGEPSMPSLQGCFDEHGMSAQVHKEQETAAYRNATAQSIASATIPMTSGHVLLGRPSMLADHWCRSLVPGNARGYILPDPGLDSVHNAVAGYPTMPPLQEAPQTATPAHTPALPQVIDQIHFYSSLSPIDPNLWISPLPAPGYSLTKKKCTLPFGIGRAAAYYVHENGFSSDPRDAVLSDLGSDGSGAMVILFRIIDGLRLRSTVVQAALPRMSLSLLIHRRGPLFVGNYSLAEYVMSAAQDLAHVATSLLNQSGSVYRPDEKLSALLVPTIMDVYCRILSFIQFLLEYLTDRAERYASDPVIPIHGLTFNGIVLTGPCTQGTLFCSSVYYLLLRLENVFGLDSVSGNGLLSTNQIDVLCSILDESDDLVQSKGIMRPTDLRKLYARVATVLERLATTE